MDVSGKVSGKFMESSWMVSEKAHGNFLASSCGKIMASSWKVQKVPGHFLESAWKVQAKVMDGSWKSHGPFMESS